MKDIENNKDKWTASSKSKLSEYNPSSDKTESYIRIGGIESGYEWLYFLFSVMYSLKIGIIASIIKMYRASSTFSSVLVPPPHVL